MSYKHSKSVVRFRSFRRWCRCWRPNPQHPRSRQMLRDDGQHASRFAVDRWSFTHRGSYQHFSDVIITPIMTILKYNEGNVYLYICITKSSKTFFFAFAPNSCLRRLKDMFCLHRICQWFQCLAEVSQNLPAPSGIIGEVYIYIHVHIIYIHMYMYITVYM